MSNLNYETVYEYVTISGQRLDMTYKIRRKVNGTNYSTTTSILLGECKRKVPHPDGWVDYYTDQLFYTRSKNFFLLSFCKKKPYIEPVITPLNKPKAKSWCQKHKLSVEFEKVLDTETDKQLNIRISSNLKDKIDKFAKDSGQSSTAWIIDLIEKETTNNGNVQKNYTGKRIEDLITMIMAVEPAALLLFLLISIAVLWVLSVIAMMRVWVFLVLIGAFIYFF